MKRLFLLGLMCLPLTTHAVDLENGKKIARSCALCHGVYGQGTPGPASPRLAGMPTGYLVKELEHYKDGSRTNLRMYVTASLASLSEEDIDDVSTYFSSINLAKVGLTEQVPVWPGDYAAGEEISERIAVAIPTSSWEHASRVARTTCWSGTTSA